MIPPFKIKSQKIPMPRRPLDLLIARSVTKGLFLFAISVSMISTADAQTVRGLDARALNILKSSCADCHKDKNGYEYILDSAELIERGFIDPSKPSTSEILRVISEKSMPPQNASLKINRPTDDEKKILEEWIASLATIESPSDLKLKKASVPPSVNEPSRINEPARIIEPALDATQPKFVEEKSLLDKAIRFLDTQPAARRASIRFFSFRNLHQLRKSRAALNPNFAKNSDLSDDHIALVKALNSLSWNSDFATMDKVPDSDGLLVWVDITSLKTIVDGKIASWTEEREWKEILKEYRYGYEVDHLPFKDLQNETGSPIPIIRADWFIANALRPPLYHQLLRIPEKEKDLETMLHFDTERNILEGQALRIGFTESKVSTRANRLIERHQTAYGYYWKSYDFLPSTAAQGKRLLKQFPTGPQFEGNTLTDTAFDYDGGEIIFSLPNQLQAYMLVQADGTRISDAPQDLVSDSTLVSGSPSIVNGLSCITCHSHGMIDPPDDEIFDGTTVKGLPLDFVRRLHRRDEGKERLQGDKERFLRALTAATKRWNPTKDHSSSAEPVSRIAKNFNNGSLGIAEIASELGVDEGFLSKKILFDSNLKQILPYSENQTIKREDWQSFRGLQTLFQRVISHLELGTPWKMSSK